MTPREYLQAAYAKSSKNQPTEIGTEATELLKVVIRAVRGLFAVAARINPTFFATQEQVAEAGGTWPRPTTAESVWRIETAAAAHVKIVPFDDRTLAGTAPAVYRFGGVYRAAGTPPAGTLEFFYSRRPSDPADLDTAIDAQWPDAYDELLVLEVALYLALKDGREEEIAGLRGDRDRWLALYLAFLEHETIGELRRYESPRFEHSSAIIPLSELLAAGTSLNLTA